MNEKKSIKVSLGTIVCIVIILLLIIALGVVYYLGFIKNNQKMSNTNDQYKEITNELADNQIFYVTEAKEENGKYVLMGEIYETPYTISKSELENLIKEGTMTLKSPGYSEELIIRKATDNEKEIEDIEYVLCPKEHTDVVWYLIKKLNSTQYCIIGKTEYSDVYKLKEGNRKITIDGNTKCIYSLDSYREETDTVANVFSKELYFSGCFNFTFQNGECVSVNEVVIGH